MMERTSVPGDEAAGVVVPCTNKDVARTDPRLHASISFVFKGSPERSLSPHTYIAPA